MSRVAFRRAPRAPALEIVRLASLTAFDVKVARERAESERAERSDDGDEPVSLADHRRLPVVWDLEMEARPKPKQVVAGILLERSTSMIVGIPGSGKGLVLVDLVYRIANNLDYYGHAILPGLCVYVAMERQGGLGARIRAWKHHHGHPKPATVVFIPQRFSLFAADGATRLLDVLADLPAPIRVVAIDTAAKAILPGDENKTHDMGTFVGNLQRIAETGPNVIGVHHLNAAGTRERGNTSFQGDVDTQILVRSADRRITLSCDKVNELDEFAPITLRVVPVPEADSATVDTAAQYPDAMLSRTQLQILKALRTAGLDADASTTTWLKAYGGPERTFYDGRSSLVARRYVAQSAGKRPRYSLTVAGKSAADTAELRSTAE